MGMIISCPGSSVLRVVVAGDGLAFAAAFESAAATGPFGLATLVLGAPAGGTGMPPGGPELGKVMNLAG